MIKLSNIKNGDLKIVEFVGRNKSMKSYCDVITVDELKKEIENNIENYSEVQIVDQKGNELPNNILKLKELIEKDSNLELKGQIDGYEYYVYDEEKANRNRFKFPMKKFENMIYNELKSKEETKEGSDFTLEDLTDSDDWINVLDSFKNSIPNIERYVNLFLDKFNLGDKIEIDEEFLKEIIYKN